MWKWGILVIAVVSSPLLWFEPREKWLTVLTIGLGLMAWGIQIFANRFLKSLLAVMMIVGMILGGLVSNYLFSFKNGFDQERFFWKTHTFEDQIEMRLRDTLYLPYRFRVFVHHWPVVVNEELSNALGIVRVNNLINMVGIINIVPLVIGIVATVKKREGKMLLGWEAVAALIGGLNRMPDWQNAFYLALPALIWQTISGWRKILHV